MGNITYKDKIQFKCEMCDMSSWGASNRFLWVGDITKQKLYICSKCAKREVGKKNWKTIEIKGE